MQTPDERENVKPRAALTENSCSSSASGLLSRFLITQLLDHIETRPEVSLRITLDARMAATAGIGIYLNELPPEWPH